MIHFKIFNNGECFNIYGEDEFASVPELIQFYRNGEGEFFDDNREPVNLNQPLHVQTSAAPLQQERFVFILSLKYLFINDFWKHIRSFS